MQKNVWKPGVLAKYVNVLLVRQLKLKTLEKRGRLLMQYDILADYLNNSKNVR